MIIEGKKASAATPISVIGDDGGVTCDGHRNHVRPPGLPEREHYAFIKILNSTGIVVDKGVVFPWQWDGGTILP